MEGGPDTSDALVQTRHRPGHLFQFLAVCFSQQLCLFPHLFIRQVPHTDSFLPAVDVVSYYYWVLAGPWRDCDFDLRVAFREFGKSGFDEGVHATRRAGPVAVMEVKSFALQDECTDAILGRIRPFRLQGHEGIVRLRHTWAFAAVLMADRGILNHAGGESDAGWID